jgi:hypothetical protein
MKSLEIEDATDTRRGGGVRGGSTIVAPTGGVKNYQGPGDLEPPWGESGKSGRAADLPGDWDARKAADTDWRIRLERNAARDKEAIGIPKALDGTPWLKSNKE